MNWPGWNREIPWMLRTAKNEKSRLKKNFAKLQTEVRNIERLAKKHNGKLKDHPKYLALENKEFISSSLYPKLFPRYNTQM